MKHLGRLTGDCRTRVRGKEVKARLSIEVWENPDGGREGRGTLIAPVDLLHEIGVMTGGCAFDFIGLGSVCVRLARPAGYGAVADVVVDGPGLKFD